MTKTDASTIEKYQEALRKDPDSKLFAPLAEAYRERGMMAEAEELATAGIKRHPQYVGGYITLGKILSDLKRFAEASKSLEKAIQLAPDNLLAYQVLAEAYLHLKRPKEALKAHKMALFLNPMSQRSRQAVEKLEVLSADEYEADVFEMRSLPQLKKDKAEPLSNSLPSDLNRSLSLLDALIVRQDMAQAKEWLRKLKLKFPDSPELISRWQLLAPDQPSEQAEPLRPQLSREKIVLDKKMKKLKLLLSVIQSKKNQIHP